MYGGIVILLIASIGACYFLYQKFRTRNSARVMREERAQTVNTQRRNQHSNQPANNSRQRPAAAAYTPHTEPVHTPPEREHATGRPLVPANLNNITETGPMVYFANDRHGRSDKEYRFNYKKVNGGWRAYILRMPSLGNRNSGSSTIHRLQDGNQYYICWDRQVNTLKDMQTISRRWADSIQEYLSTGKFG